MLNTVAVRTSQGTVLTLPLGDYTSGLIVENIEGLDPVKATLVSSSFANMDGSQYQSARRESRNIKLTLALEPDYVNSTVSDLRKQLYQFFMPKSEVNLSFQHDDGLNVEIVGRIESLETVLFTKEPTVDISILCFDPDFLDPLINHVTGGTVATTTEQLIPYAGTVESGFYFTMTANRSISEFLIYHRPPGGATTSLYFAVPMVSGDKVEINTLAGAKGAWITKAGIRTSALYGVSASSKWIELLPGDNLLRVYAVGATVPFTIDYTTRYGGL